MNSAVRLNEITGIFPIYSTRITVFHINENRYHIQKLQPYLTDTLLDTADIYVKIPVPQTFSMCIG